MTLRVVLDTNILISGIFWEGNYCSQIIYAWRAGKITLVSSQEIIQEFVETLRDFKIAIEEDMIQEWRNMLIENSIMAVPMEKVNTVKNDESDNKFFDAAVAGKARYVISQDKKHILSIQQFRQIKTIHPEKFVKYILREIDLKHKSGETWDCMFASEKVLARDWDKEDDTGDTL